MTRRPMTPEDEILAQVTKNYRTSSAKIGRRRVECYVSPRYLAFSEKSDLLDDGHDLMFVDVMTTDMDDNSRKLCELIIDRRDLLAALDRVKTVPFRPKE